MKRLIEPEFPSSDKLQLYGALAFLYFHSARHRRWPLESLRLILQPPVDLDQAKIFYHEGAPRGAITWGLLDEAAERAQRQRMAAMRARRDQALVDARLAALADAARAGRAAVANGYRSGPCQAHGGQAPA